MPVLADLAALRDAAASLCGRVDLVEPSVPAELVVDHSVIADVFGRPDASRRNVELEYSRNAERFRFLRAVRGLTGAVDGDRTVTVLADGRPFPATVRLDTPREADYYRHGGVLPYVLRRLLAGK